MDSNSDRHIKSFSNSNNNENNQSSGSEISEEQFDLSNEESFNKQRRKLDTKVENFFEKICKKTMNQSSASSNQHEKTQGSSKNFYEEDDAIDKLTQSIHYGNVKDSYDPNARQTQVQKTTLIIKQEEIDSHYDDDEEQANSLIKLIEANNETFFDNLERNNQSTNLNELNLVRKNSIIFMIERNRTNKILCPFDELAYRKIQYNSLSVFNQVFDPKLSSSELQMSFKVFDDEESVFPNCMSTFLMPLFFDIFQASELKQFSPKIVDIILKLKTSYVPQIHLNEKTHPELFKSQLISNCLWNCFALFKFKYNPVYKWGFLNYLSSMCFLNKYYFLKNNNFYTNQDFFNCKVTLKYYAMALHETGFLTHGDILMLKNLAHYKNRNVPYLEDLVDIVNSVLGTGPMRLSSLCRVFVIKTMQYFNLKAIKSLNLSNNEHERFLLFDFEIEKIYESVQDFFHL
jgi:hypothetical protein